MRKLIWCLSLMWLICLCGCPGESASNTANTNTGSSNKPPNSPLPTATPVVKTSESNAGGNYQSTNSANTMKSANSTKQANTAGSGNTASSGNSNNPTPQPTAPTTAEKPKDAGLFSFPPPKVTDVTVISQTGLLSREGATTLAQVSEKLSEGLENAGYKRGKYRYFWNERDEFAVVTAMERVNADGSNFVKDRWVEDEDLPSANTFIEYFRYLIEGKKVFYRVFAFVVTARRAEEEFRDGSPPEFVTALNWREKGKSQLGDGETTTVESVIFTPRHKCYALVYLFVNHTSLDLPKSVDLLQKSERRLQEDLVKEADVHVNKTNLRFGE